MVCLSSILMYAVGNSWIGVLSHLSIHDHVNNSLLCRSSKLYWSKTDIGKPSFTYPQSWLSRKTSFLCTISAKIVLFSSLWAHLCGLLIFFGSSLWHINLLGPAFSSFTKLWTNHNQLCGRNWHFRMCHWSGVLESWQGIWTPWKIQIGPSKIEFPQS